MIEIGDSPDSSRVGIRNLTEYTYGNPLPVLGNLELVKPLSTNEDIELAEPNEFLNDVAESVVETVIDIEDNTSYTTDTITEYILEYVNMDILYIVLKVLLKLLH